MHALYRKPKEGENVEMWEGVEFVSALIPDELVDQYLDKEWVKNPHDLCGKIATQGVELEKPKRGRKPKE